MHFVGYAIHQDGVVRTAKNYNLSAEIVYALYIMVGASSARME